MYKGSCRHMQWKSKEKSYANKDKIPENLPQIKADFIRTLKKGLVFKGIVTEIKNGKVLLEFCHGQIRGELVGEYNVTRISSADLLTVRLSEITLGKDGCVYLLVEYISGTSRHRPKIFKCNKCDYETTDITEFRQHLDYKCTSCICKYCGQRYDNKDEFKHLGGKCCKTINPIKKKKKIAK